MPYFSFDLFELGDTFCYATPSSYERAVREDAVRRREGVRDYISKTKNQIDQIQDGQQYLCARLNNLKAAFAQNAALDMAAKANQELRYLEDELRSLDSRVTFDVIFGPIDGVNIEETISQIRRNNSIIENYIQEVSEKV